ncbi:MAG: ribosome biogenesis GTPase YlqF [Eubacteriaceae bacterium]|nr:ribosome biogenesis GTPase YlqF [Eubacteriaceae bacterium]
MAKAQRSLANELKNVDAVVVLGDARAVVRSVSGDFLKHFAGKRLVYAFNKSSLADEQAIAGFKKTMAEKDGYFFIDCKTREGIKQFSSHLLAMKNNFRYEREVRAMIVGIPNVGKSMLINTLAGRNANKIANTPGVTRSNKWLRIEGSFYLLDTPGILSPKFDNEDDGMVLASIGSVKDTIFDKTELAESMAFFLARRYPHLLEARYKISPGIIGSATPIELIEEIGKRRGFVQKGAVVDFERAANTLFDEFKNGVIGKIAFDFPQEDRF